MENKFPKNVRQIGNVSDIPKIYVEDYVDTFLNQLCDKPVEIPAGACLIGHTVKQDEQDCIYVSGAIQIPDIEMVGNYIKVSDESWEKIKSEQKEFFPDGELIGWCLVRTDGVLQLETEWKKFHEQYFGHFGTVFILKNAEEEQYFAYKYKELMEMSGHYIYYEKNEAMQNYMIQERKRIGVTPSEDVEDKAAKEFRNIVKERIIVQEEKKHSRFMKVASALLLIVVLGIGVTTVNNYGKMQNLQSSLDYIKESIAMKEKDTADKTVQTSGEVAEKNEVVEETQEVVDEEQQEQEKENTENQQNNELASGSEAEITSTMQEMSEDIYIVEKGDTLAKISKKVYGDVGHVDAICRMNGLSDGNLIFIGQKLLLP